MVGFAEDDTKYQPSGALDSTLDLDLGSKDLIPYPRHPGYSVILMVLSLPMYKAKGIL